MTFTHLHVRTAYSAHYGVARPEALVAAAAADGADALGCTDRDGLYGAVKHLGACRAAGVDPILGVDLRVGDSDGERFHRVVVLAAGAGAGLEPGEGYAALCRLISDAHRLQSQEGSVPGRPSRLGAGPSASFLPGVSRQQLRERAAPGISGAPVRLVVLLGPDSEIGRAHV